MKTSLFAIGLLVLVLSGCNLSVKTDFSDFHTSTPVPAIPPKIESGSIQPTPATSSGTQSSDTATGTLIDTEANLDLQKG